MLLDLVQSIGVASWLVLLSCLLIGWYMMERKATKLPPYPSTPVPVIGHLHLIKKNPRHQFRQWGKDLGGIFSLKTGSQTIVIITSFELMKEAFVKKGEYFSDRLEKSFLGLHLPHNNKGILNASGHNWKEQRTVALNILRNFGMGKNSLAEKIAEEVAFYLKEISSKKGKPFEMRNLTNMSVSNVICSIIFGQRFELNDSNFLKLIKLINDLVILATGISKINFFPVLKHVPFDPFHAKKLLSTATEFREYAKSMVGKLKTKYDANNLDNFIVAYIDEIKKKEKLGQSTYLDEINLARTIDNLFIAGTETTSTTIIWAILYSMNYPEVQKKIYQEIVDNVGTDRIPNMQDKPKLKYLSAFIMESQRMASILPLSLAHVCSQESTVGGFTIPKGTQVFPALDGVLKDEAIWGDPENFRPERFLDAQSNIVTREELIPFSLGRRVCLGEALAKMELFLYLSAMFQRFEFLPDDPKCVPPMADVFGITVTPEPYNVRCVERQV